MRIIQVAYYSCNPSQSPPKILTNIFFSDFVEAATLLKNCEDHFSLFYTYYNEYEICGIFFYADCEEYYDNSMAELRIAHEKCPSFLNLMYSLLFKRWKYFCSGYIKNRTQKYNFI